ncbi:hypothetical protein PpBr36_09123 [Pyricularia pennisetigena]|uniref:hypothetical protein n=1 Tax=Pyricularia pennisetigena TaxID=1578925 RepID=UPI001153D176|nr:hypothetical protein PpBr36_09123 [Pyricularia pennisetigena]TLS23834.1 hypothetical protein PpBr36_09123 [Pyricularia pennisetigena]
MTSNRANSIDPAFKSRVHLILHYPELSESAKCILWKQFVMRAGWPSNLTDQQYDGLAKLGMNGREIKNAVKIAFLLASREEKPLEVRHVKTVLDATREAGADRWWPVGREDFL